ncbi:MAG: fibronectin type III domain-containing protein [Ruminiclostridium sp.]|nr:fibronectin type III domain-containing protein [Ruminiclostridium sp.]
MKKTKIIGVLLAGAMAFSGVPEVMAPLTAQISAASTLASPTGIKATSTSGSVKLTWNKVSGADAYRVYKYNSYTKKYDTYKTVKSTSCTVSKLSPNTNYKFRIAALVKKSNGSYSVQTKSAVYTVRTKLTAPTKLTATAGASSVKLTWEKVTGADAYRVYKYNSSTKKFETYKNVTATSCTVTGLSAGTYQFKVAALVESGKKYVAQAQSDAVKAKIGASAKSGNFSLISFPAFGKSKTDTIKEMGLTGGMNVDNIKPGVEAYAGYKTINGEKCMVMLYFNESSKFFYGAAIVSKEALTFSRAFSSLKSANGSDYISVEKSGIKFYEWVNTSDQSAELITGIDGADVFVYGKISVKYAPDSMKNATGDPMSALGDLRGLLG